MARNTGTKNIISNGSQTLQGSGSVNVVSTGSGVNIVSGTGTNITVGTNLNIIVVSPSGLITVGNNTNTVPGFVTVNATANVGSVNNITGRSYDGSGNLTLDNGSIVSLDQTLFSNTVERKEASAYFAGGVGIEQDLSVGGFIYGRVAAANTATTSSQIIVLSSNSATQYYLTFVQDLNTQGTILYGDNISDYTPTGLRYQPDIGKIFTERLAVQNTENSTSTISGAATVAGGVGIAKDLYVGGAVLPAAASTGTIGEPDYAWATAYLDNVYTRFVGNTNSNIAISPNNGISDQRHGTGGVVDIFGDIRVRGNNPIGTAPVVTNILYVTMDGDDTNDGRAQDASRACRTISGAVNSPYYQSGTQIRVAPGHYLENNPIQLKPYTSVMGSDLRTTGIEPINKTQDLFHMNSGCYLAFMQFLNGRSGLLPGTYAPGYNRGAYCTAFPPLKGSDRIDLFHSPYIQNCTNLSGPWLVDGTMFVPDETVQVPTAVGIGSWEINTTTIVVNVANEPVSGFINAGVPGSSSTQYTGNLSSLVNLVGNINSSSDLTGVTSPNNLDGYIANDTGDLWVYTGATSIELGMSVGTGEQNPGFFNARSLMLANKPFLQSQVASYIQSEILANISNTSSIWYDFSTNLELSYRDTGILIENISYDAAFGGNEKSIESGLAYWNGPVSYIATSIPQCIAAINYLESLVQQVITNTTATSLPSVPNIPVGNQVINTVLVGGDVASPSIVSLFGIITDIIANGPGVAPTSYNSTGPDAAFVSAEILLQANRQFIQENTLNYINYFLVGDQPDTYLPYNQIKCARDTGIIVDSIAADLLYPTDSYSQTTFAGLQYYAQGGYTGNIASEITTTTAAMSYLQQIALKVIQHITPEQDAILGINRYSNSIQLTDFQPGTDNEVAILNSEFAIILSILNGNTIGWTDRVVANGPASRFTSVQDAYNLLLENIPYMQDEIYAYITASDGLNYDPANYNVDTCRRDIGYIINSVAFDLLHGGNRQAIQSGLSYYSQNPSVTLIPGETTATSAAFTFLGNVIKVIATSSGYVPLQSQVLPVTSLPLADNTVLTNLSTSVDILTNIITNGPAGFEFTPISLSESTDTQVQLAYAIINANREFLVAEVTAWINNNYNAGAFVYDQAYCYRDIGLMVDAVSQDILLGGNQRSIEAGLSYWNQGYNYIANEVSTTTAAISYISSIAQQIIANQPVDVITGTNTAQVINSFFQYGNDYMPQEAIARNFNIISTIIASGPQASPPVYAGGGLFALTGLNGADVKLSPKVTYLETISTGTYLVGLSTATIGQANNATLYFGSTHVFPLQDNEVEIQSLQQTGNSSSWDSRKVDPLGGMGGSLVDGAVISDRSPIQSFVYDAFTQLTQGGVGVKITNNGYAQLVSVFTIFASVGVQVDNGGIASIVNSNANFGDICLLAKGYGKRSFSGTVFNPPNRSYPFSPNLLAPLPDPNALDQYYPSGYWPNKGLVEVFVPDIANRPHISQVMEVIAPEGHINEQSLPGFLNAQPSTGTLVTGSIVLENISNSDIAVGNTVYIRDQFGSFYDPFPWVHDEFGNPILDSLGNTTTNVAYGILYADTGTVVTDVGYNSITLNQALTSGASFPDNPNYFTLYFCGNAYYTVQTSSVADSPYQVGTNILSANTDPNYQGPATDQIAAHIDSIRFLNTLIDQIIANTAITPSVGNTATQFISSSVAGGQLAQPFIDLRFNYITSIIGAANINAAESVVPQSNIIQTGTAPTGAGSAITLIQNNIDFLAGEVYAYVQANYSGLLATSGYQADKCNRDVGLILQQIIYDLESGGNYNSVNAGLSYWARGGTHHIVELGEAVNRTELFPDGAIVNFYQRSYISASGYVFEYVGAGTNYGALPQVGRADPVQAKETVQLNYGKVFFTSTDQNGDFRIGPGLVISQATGVLSGRTFTQSLFANMTPFILAIEGI